MGARWREATSLEIVTASGVVVKETRVSLDSESDIDTENQSFPKGRREKEKYMQPNRRKSELRS